MRVGDHPIVPALPDAVVGHATIHVLSIVSMEGVSVDTVKQDVALEGLLISQVFLAIDIRYFNEHITPSASGSSRFFALHHFFILPVT
jgi:hypothetical protein